MCLCCCIGDFSFCYIVLVIGKYAEFFMGYFFLWGEVAGHVGGFFQGGVFHWEREFI